MQGVLEGFATIGVIIALGFLLGHIGVLDLPAQLMLSRLSFFVASPALMVTVLENADVANVFSKNLVASFGAVVVSGLCYLAMARLVWRMDTGDTVIGVLSSVYVNAGNLGLPIAAYVLGDAALAAPVLLMQLLVMQPVALAFLDSTTTISRFSLWRTVTRAVTNPLTAGSILGLFLAVTGLRLPQLAHDPLELVGGIAVPAMLLAYGVSLRLGPRPGAGASAAKIGYITALKLVVQPLAGYVIAHYMLGLNGTSLLAVTVMAALPTAQNIFIHATRYDHAMIVARDSIFMTTVLSVPAMFAVVTLIA